MRGPFNITSNTAYQVMARMRGCGGDERERERERERDIDGASERVMLKHKRAGEGGSESVGARRGARGVK